MSERTTPVHSRLRTFLLVAGGFFLGVAVTIGGMWLSMYYFVSWVTESDISVGENPEGRLFEATAKLAESKNEYERWLALGDVAMWNVDAGSLDKASAFAQELLATADHYRNDWNYGNAIHKSHLVLGRIELRKGNTNSAVRHLLEAGKTAGSPQLNSFGPNMTLAKELLDVGERKPVLEYMELCGRFWKNDFGALAKWKQMIRSGRVPNFGANLLY